MAMKEFTLIVECNTIEELSQMMRLAADAVIRDVSYFDALAVDEQVDIADEPTVILQRCE